MARHMEGPVEDWNALLAERRQEEDPADEDKRHEIALLQLFRQRFQPSCERIYYPGSGTNQAVRRVFPDSHITYVDADPDEIRLRELMGAEAQATLSCEFADDYQPAEEMDIVYGHYAQFDLTTPMETVKVGGYYLCNMNDAAGMFDAALRSGDFKLEAVLRARTVLERICSISGLIRSQLDASLQSRYAVEDGDLADYVTPCKTDAELRQRRPDIYWRQRRDVPDPARPDAILRSVQPYTAINSPKRTSADNAIYVFRRVRRTERLASAGHVE